LLYWRAIFDYVTLSIELRRKLRNDRRACALALSGRHVLQ
jgi:hypothetical protein